MMSSSHPQSLHGQMLNHDRLVLPSSLASVIGRNSFMQDTRSESNFTLLSRAQQPVGTVDPSTIGPIIPPRSSLESSQSSSMPSASLTSAVSFTGRAARDDYFDTEDPSVNLHDFIINSMQSQKNRVILIKLEEEFVSYVQDVNRIEPLKLPPWDSYHRMLAHRVAAYFGLEHNVDPLDKMCVIVHKGPNTRLPQRRFSDCMAKVQEELEPSEPKLILKRTAKEVAEAKKLETILGSSSDVSVLKSLKTFEEREEEYERARARIFNQQSPLETKEPSPSVVFDLETASARRKSRILPAIMQHRRAASDTTAFLFNRGAMSELRKEGPSSDHSSRSITPLLSHLNKSTEALCRAIGSCQELDQSPSKQLSPHTPRKISQYDQHGMVTPSPPKFSKSLSDFNSSSAHEANQPSTLSPTAAHFQSVQSGVPVIYQHPGTVIADPNWYSYQQMMVYQVSPHGYVPAPQYSPFGQAVLQPGQVYAVNQPFPTVPAGGSLAPGTVLAPGKDPQMSPQGVSTRPGGVQGFEQYPSPAPPPGIALVKPIPQQASPLRVASRPVGPWGSPIHQPFAIHQPVVVQPQSDQPAYATLVPYPQDIRTSQLADQIEGSLHISDPSATDGLATSETLKNFSSKPSDSALGSQFGRSAPLVGSSTPVDGLYTVSTMGVGGANQNLVGGQVVSPTLPRAPMPFIPQQVPHPMCGGGPETAFVGHGSQGSFVRYPAGFSQASSPAQPSTPGQLNFPPGVLQGRPQGVFSPSNTGLTHSPVQILGHTLGTSLFSPPPSTSSHPALFGQVSSKTLGDAPTHPPIGTGAVPDNPGLMPAGYNSVPTSGTNSQSGQLPPRLTIQGRHKSGPNRYQNQRHPANRGSKGQVTGAQDLTATADFVSTLSSTGKKEALLPTPPSHQLVKLDTTLTCGVPLNVMELASFPLDGTPEMLQVIQALNDMGVKETKTGVLPKTGERVMIAVFDTADLAVKALQVKHPHFVLSIPGNNHAKFILSLL